MRINDNLMSLIPKSFSLANNCELDISEDEITYTGRQGIYRISKPTAIRYGTIPMDIYHLRLGYNYKIQLLDDAKNTVSIPFKCYFGIGSEKIYDLFNKVIDTLWEYHFSKVYEELVNQYNSGLDLIFADKYKVTGEGLILLNKEKIIPFDKMKVDDRFDHFIINSKEDKKTYAIVYYMSTWNSAMLFSLLNAAIEKETDI